MLDPKCCSEDSGVFRLLGWLLLLLAFCYILYATVNFTSTRIIFSVKSITRGELPSQINYFCRFSHSCVVLYPLPENPITAPNSNNTLIYSSQKYISGSQGPRGDSDTEVYSYFWLHGDRCIRSGSKGLEERNNLWRLRKCSGVTECWVSSVPRHQCVSTGLAVKKVPVHCGGDHRPTPSGELHNTFTGN